LADLVGEKHVRVQIQGSDGTRLKAIAFRSAENELGRVLMGGRNAPPLHIAGHLRLDSWQGEERVQMTIEDAAIASG
jgi:single-stranded-DNA-specific exonuclease